MGAYGEQDPWTGGGGGGGLPTGPAGGDLAGTYPNPSVRNFKRFEFSRSGNTGVGAPIGPAGGNNAAPGFVIPADGQILAWEVSYQSNGSNLAGVLIEIEVPAGGGITTTAVQTAATTYVLPRRGGSGTVSIPVSAGDLLRVRSNMNGNSSQITVTLFFKAAS